MRVESLDRMWMFVLLLLTALPGLQSAHAETPRRSTVIVFADHTMRESAWEELFAAMNRDLAEANGPGAPTVELMRGDDVKPGIVVEQSVSVYLEGSCTLMPGPKQTVEGALGWVPLVHGEIEPFVHVDCTRIRQMLAPMVLGIRPELRERVMGEAIARVVEHEWLHIATQSAAHSEHGVMQAQFTVYDLLHDEEFQRRGRGLGR